MPAYTDHCPDLASFSPKLLSKKKTTKKADAEAAESAE